MICQPSGRPQIYTLWTARNGSSDSGNNKKVVIEYSSPNIVKEFHLGHLRSTAQDAKVDPNVKVEVVQANGRWK